MGFLLTLPRRLFSPFVCLVKEIQYIKNRYDIWCKYRLLSKGEYNTFQTHLDDIFKYKLQLILQNSVPFSL